MTTRLTLISAPPAGSRRSPVFPGRDRLVLSFGSLPGTVRRCLTAADRLFLPPEIVIDHCSAASPPPEVAEALSEVDFGSWTSREMTDVAGSEAGAFEAWQTDMTAAPPHGEAWEDVRTRVGGWLAATGDQAGRIVAVCPPAIVRVAIVAALDAPLPMIRRLDPTPWSAAELTGHRGRWALRL